MMKDADKIKNLLNRKLLTWYRRNQRSLPWRKTSDPYRKWISEIMLQQTQVDTVIPYYHRFLKAFPTVSALARAPLQDVLKAWENLGYYSRARNIHAAAKVIVEKFGDQIPDNLEEIKTLPGIGEYSAGAILSIAYGQALPAVDGNVRRILCRLFAIRQPADDAQEQKQLQNLAASLIPVKHPGDFNQALMDLGATICKAKNPGLFPLPSSQSLSGAASRFTKCSADNQKVPRQSLIVRLLLPSSEIQRACCWLFSGQHQVCWPLCGNCPAALLKQMKTRKKV